MHSERWRGCWFYDIFLLAWGRNSKSGKTPLNRSSSSAGFLRRLVIVGKDVVDIEEVGRVLVESSKNRIENICARKVGKVPSLKENLEQGAGGLWRFRQRRLGAFTFLGTVLRVPQRLTSSGSFLDVVNCIICEKMLSRLPITAEIKFIT